MIINRSGMLEFELICADPVTVISYLLDMGITLKNYTQSDDITANIIVAPNERRKIMNILEEKGIQYRIVRKQGLHWRLTSLIRRPVLVAGLFLFLFLTIATPNRVLFINVEGNETVTTQEILLASEDMGLYFGSSRKNIRSEKIKNYLLEEIPQLQWAGVNSKGCVATISVREREQSLSRNKYADGMNLVAARDGIIREITLHSGTALCTVGQMIREGQILVSGYEDCGICIRARNVEAEIFADTKRNITAKMTSLQDVRIEKTDERKKYSVIFAKKRINLFKDTGISDASCVKMYEQYYISLPGGYVLPFSVIAYTETQYSSATSALTEAEAEYILTGVADQYLLAQMVSGRIRHKYYNINITEDSCIFNGTYSCYEMIGQLRNEEKYNEHEYTNRENR